MGKFIITEDEKKHIMSLYEQSALWDYSPAKMAYDAASTLWDYSPAKMAYNTVKDLEFLPPAQMAYQIATKVKKEFTFDDLINLTSAMLDGVPGVGNLISLGIDYTHAISYFTRCYISNNEEDKVQHFISGIVLLLMANLPIAGNMLSMSSSNYLKRILKQSPEQILKFLGLKTINITKEKWKYCVVALFMRIFRGESISKLTNIKETIKPFLDLPLGKPYKDAINYFSNTLDEIIGITGQSKPDYNVQII